MIDPYTYRQNEQLAKSAIPSWRVSQIHNVDHFERAGFPVRLSSIRELGQIVDTMQENRFARYMTELGGLTASEYELVVSACKDLVEFQLTFLPHRPAVLPISTILSAFALYKKMLGANPSFQSVLEIGPGCGYVSFLLRRHASLINYSQIEACESFYMLQNLVNLFAFGPRFDERALPVDLTTAVDYFVNPRADMEFSPKLRLRNASAACTHYPWWRIGEIVSKDRSFDIVTSNANLLEFNASALDDYLSLLHRCLKPEGVFLVQCTGYPANGNVDDLLQKLRAKGFAPLMLVKEQTPASFPGDKSKTLLDRLGTGDGQTISFTTNNALFVKQGHPLFQQYFQPQNYHWGFIAPEQIVKHTFFSRSPEGKQYTLQDFVAAAENQ